MKEIKAYVAKRKLGAITRALHKVEGITGMSVIDHLGYGRGLAVAAEPELDFHHGIKIEIICKDELVDTIVSAIEKVARTGLKSDGKIYVSPIEQAIRISTGERGDGAI